MWNKFEGVARNQADTLARIKALNWTDWHPSGITLHNTAAPTLAQWAESGPSHDARIRNLQNYYENELGWHAGPHFFVSRNWINWFSNPLLPGVHSRCWNATRFGIEMVGDYNAETFDTGDGAMVRDNTIFLMAALNNKFGFKASNLTFHVECPQDNHDCPGKNVHKADVIRRVEFKMAELAGMPAPVQPAPEQGMFTDIVATEFGGEGEEQPSAYPDVARGWPNRPGVALPFRFVGPRPIVRVFKGSKSIDCPIVDVGPWNGKTVEKSDPYWKTGNRPQAESGIDLNGRRTNKAGIDLTPAAAKFLGIDGKGTVDWKFVGDKPTIVQPTPKPTVVTVSKPWWKIW